MMLPQTDALSQPYWDAAAQGRLLIQRCEACGAYQWYPRAHCVACGGGQPAWVEAAGRGVVHTFSVVHRTPNAEFADSTPYVFAIVELEEGVRMASQIVGVEPAGVRCELPVRVVFPPGDGPITLPCFTGD